MGKIDLTLALRRLLAVGTVVLLAACGGGDPEPDEVDSSKPTPPVNCAARPELCR